MPIPNSKLEKIHIKSIKGIKDKTFELNLYPNKPAILVAPNGFGKSSFAVAFSSFNNRHLALDESNLCQMENLEPPSIKIFHDGKNYTIDGTTNTFSNHFASYVINCSLYAKSKSQYIGGYTVPRASLEIKEIEVYHNIPEKVHLNYSISQNKEDFGKNGKVLPNINYLLSNSKLFSDLQIFDIKIFDKKRTYITPLNNIKEKINNYVKTTNEIISNNESLLEDFDNIECLKKLKNIVQLYTNKDNEILIYLECIQLVNLFKDNNFKKHIKRCHYELQKENLNSLINDFNTTGLELKLIEERKNNNKKLVFKFPSANRISNGQRDILTFIAKLTKAQSELNKQNNLLIIDEIFDYLDDANLVSFQYYITKFIEYYKKNSKNLYCILLTHLDPEYINNFCFAQHKLQIRYLMNTGSTQQSNILSLIKKRTQDKSVEKDISHYLLHYDNEEKTVEGYYNKSFYEKMYDEVKNKYLKDEKYDSLKVCLATRIKIEENIYNKLATQELKKQFIEQHKTKEKLNFAATNGVEVPDIYFLLGIIYNDNLHWKENRDYDTPLCTKLSNLVIKNMIKSIFEEEV